MKTNYKPILFSTEMVQALLEGRKTQTRRVHGLTEINRNPDSFGLGNVVINNYFNFYKIKTEKGSMIPKVYNSGDILWVRETCKVGAWDDENYKIAFDYKASPELKKTPWIEYESTDDFDEIHLKSIEELERKGFEPEIDEENERVYYKWKPGDSPLNWKPSIFMPKEAARIFLEVINVRCERLQDISEEDAIAEGIEPGEIGFKSYNPKNIFEVHALWSFQNLWESINGKNSWKANPWVWVYEFKIIDKPAVWPS